ncbi:dynamin family protein [Aneurinibacillus uraniidurans]|uniref:dynamin family protein n=1 Tax=Aneurinibacillus uraniidurans TaxID=2966586 RepID=UPI00234B5986|nr:dynamin family protein [Aneurinibacillus sp. B1]WCN38833.1 dynamin family protein [Aneurinibacillus sp. B1]
MIETVEARTGQEEYTHIPARVLYRRVEALAEAFAAAGDEKNARKSRQLLEKLYKKEFTVAFCGHFSAGKSSMINALMGDKVLPSSPIPTSANVVSIKTGKKSARIYFKDSEPLEFGPDYNVNELKQYAVNGEEVETIELYHPSNLLGEAISIMDTPGIDSTDDAHKVSTESSLHLSDAVLYVMDYNHVQSEVNFRFTKSLKDRGVPVYLVINQIDKHVDFELSFAQYRESVIDAFRHWDIEPDGVYFTSLKDVDHPENQWPMLLAELGRLFAAKEELLIPSIMRAAHYLIDEHGKFLEEKHTAAREPLMQVLAEADENAVTRYEELTQHLVSLRQPADALETEAKRELHTMLDNAPLMPFTTRELARQFLESRQSSFKVGFLFSAGKKTKEERDKRLRDFYEELKENAAKHIGWHVKELLRKLPEAHGYDDSEFQKRVMEFDVSFGPELIENAVKPGALTSGEYILTYSKDVSDSIKQLYRRAAQDEYEYAVQQMRKQAEVAAGDVRAELATLAPVKEAKDKLAALTREETAAAARFVAMIDQGVPNEASAPPLPGYTEPEAEKVEGASLPAAASGERVTLQTQASTSGMAPSSSAIQKDYRGLRLNTADLLRVIAGETSGVPGLAGAGHAMRQRAERLEKNRFTVALFGAFSAGKSSFANALMGDLILPVSPNPTTAAINKILPPDEQNPHGSVRVRLKTAEDMTSDVLQSLDVFDIAAGSIEEAIQKSTALNAGDIHPTAKPHYSFLRAVQKGYAEIKNELGTDLIIGLEEFQAFVAKEEKACFVEWIELYYDCPLTQQGIILVDTPGADSINARHTGVAFEYIKNADAVLFVTYYNHAFSHADREFLIQLGRVKDTFAMDKMFFIVNAADLAHSQEELDGVVNHVVQNLGTCGIVRPRIYPVSSQTALLARMGEKNKLTDSGAAILRKRLSVGETEALPSAEEALTFSGLRHFEKEFISFTLEELTGIALKEAFAEVERVIGTMDELIVAARQDAGARAEQLSRTERKRETSLATIRDLDTAADIQALEKEVTELAYYVKQRVMLRFSEAFRYAFNPTNLTEANGRNMQKLLRASLDELSRFLAFDLAQEMRATALRAETFMAKNGEKVTDRLNKRLDIEHFFLRAWEQPTYDTPAFASQLPEGTTGDLAAALSLFKNPKQFFEQGGQDKMKDTLEQRYQVPVQAYVDGAAHVLHDYYVPAFRTQLEQLAERAVQEVEEHFAGLIAVLSTDIDVEGLASLRQAIAGRIQTARAEMDI